MFAALWGGFFAAGFGIPWCVVFSMAYPQQVGAITREAVETYIASKNKRARK